MIEAFMAVPTFLLAILVTAWVKIVAVRTQLLALPTERSSHHLPTPVGGGLSIVVGYLLGLCMGWNGSPGSEMLALIASLPVALIGLIDDRRPVDFRVRLLVQAVGALYVLLLLGELPPIMFGSVSVDLALWAWVLVPLALLWLTNLYNFMDGIDGLAGAEACFVTAAAASILLWNGDLLLALLCLCIFASAAGFLVFNWSPATIFMGDVGSGFTGYSLGLIALLSLYHGSMNVWTWLLLLAAFIVDATVTLFRRVLAGRRWYHAHRTHAYQHAAKQYNSHSVVSMSVSLINLVWLFPLAWLAESHPEYGVYLVIAGVVPLVVLANFFKAGRDAS